MAHRSTLSLVAFAVALSVTGLAQAQRRPRRPHLPAAAAAHGPAHRGASHTQGSGTLGEGDADGSGRFVRTRSVRLTRGDAVSYGASSGDFDAVARAQGPDGQTWEDDDGAGRGTDALLRFVAPESGRYRLSVTSYGEGETGDFRDELTVTPGESVNDEGADDAIDDTAPAVAATPSGDGGTTYGVFVGITHYRGENDDLPGTADDARNLAQSFERAGWMERHNAVVLTDEHATADRVRQAFATLAPRMGPRDMLVFFFDGHGSANELDLRGRDITRRDLSRLLDGVRGRSLVVLDSCNAGGFASVVRDHADRAGLFSSRADESSEVASEVGAGGWLAWHFRRAVDGGVRRRPDGSIDFDEVARYVQAQYRQSRVEDQHLVALHGRRRGAFAIGGASDGAEPTAPGDVMVAHDDRRAPEPTPGDNGWTDDNGAQSFPAVDGFGQAVNLGVGLATATLQAITK